MIDRDGYRPNVAIVLCNSRNEVFWGKRIKEHSWQFPQGGIKVGESPEEAMFRELEEETGLLREHVKILGRTRGWLHYTVPTHWVKREWRGSYKGQKQIWYLLRLVGRDHDIRLRASTHPEFDAWRWHDYWVPLDTVIEFKRDVYREALQQLVRYLDHGPRRSRDMPPNSKVGDDLSNTGVHAIIDSAVSVEDGLEVDGLLDASAHLVPLDALTRDHA
jgi:putative (di)nucleoside polyphosphate hydrolase